MNMLYFFGCVIAVILATLLIFLFLNAPHAIAKTRRHSKVTAISICGWMGILVPICWLIAFIWAYTEDNRIKTPKCILVKSQSFDPIPSTFAPRSPVELGADVESPGRFRIDGVDRESGMDTTWRCNADSQANARVKAELQGIVVTAVHRED